MSSSTTQRLRRTAVATALSASIAVFGVPAVASAQPYCEFSTAGNPQKCCAKVGDAPGPGPNCTRNDMQNQRGGLLGILPGGRGLL
jgi:hypothetical protein